MDVYERMSELGIVLPEAPGRGGVYAPVKEFAGNLAYISGCGPQNGSENTYIGKLGQEAGSSSCTQRYPECAVCA